MSGLTEALAEALNRADDVWMAADNEPDPHWTAFCSERILADPAFREALTREVAEALASLSDHPETFRLYGGLAVERQRLAAAIVARLLGPAT